MVRFASPGGPLVVVIAYDPPSDLVVVDQDGRCAAQDQGAKSQPTYEGRRIHEDP
jgi:hypothetical protein